MASATPLERFARTLFRILLHLHPAQFRDEYEKEMTLVFLDRLRSETGSAARVLVMTTAAAAILVEAPKQHAAILMQDLRLAMRVLRREKGFATVTLGTLALGIGLTTAVFSVAKSLLVDPLPYRDADRIVTVWVSNPKQGFDRDFTSYPRLQDWRQQSRLIDSFAAYTFSQTVMTGVDDPEQLRVARVTPDFFDIVHMAPLAGRLLAADEDQARVVVIGYGLWQRKFGGDPHVVGRTLRLDGIPHLVVGVLPPAFQFPARDTDAWLPLDASEAERVQRGTFWLRSVGRVRRGASLALASQDMDAIARRLASQYPDDRDLGVTLVSLRDELSAPFKPALLMLTAAVLGVLLVACANVAAMLTARGAARRREIAVRTALGAGRRRVMRQLLTEVVALFMTGGALGVAAAWLLMKLLVVAAPPTLERLTDATLDGPMVAGALAMALVTGVLFGVLPSRTAAATEMAGELAAGTKGLGRAAIPQRLRRGLVIAQIAVATTVMSSASLLVRSLLQMQDVDLGFEPRHVLTARVDLPPSRYSDGRLRVQFFERLLERVRALPGVTSAAMSSSVLLAALPNSASFTPEGRTEIVMEPLTYDSVTPAFFRTLQIRLVRGRLFSHADREGQTEVAIVNETTARKCWPNADPIGKRFKFGGPADNTPWLTVVGVVADTRRAGVDHAVFTESYQPLAQRPRRSMAVIIRTHGDPSSAASALRGVVRNLDPQQPLARVATLEELLDERTATRRFNTWLLSGFGMAALALTAIGLYGLLAYLVALRRHELAVRAAIGAEPRQILGLVLRNISWVVVAGLGLGMAGAFVVAPWLRSLLFGIRPTDVVSQVTVVAVLATAALLAAWAPLRRATRIDPAAALRSE